MTAKVDIEALRTVAQEATTGLDRELGDLAHELLVVLDELEEARKWEPPF